MAIPVPESAQLQIKAEDLQDYLISPGNVFITLKSGKVLQLFRAGTPIDRGRMQHYLALSKSLSIERVTDFLNVKRSQELWLSLREERDFAKVPEARLKILHWFKKVYWDGTESGSLLDLVNIGEQVFYKLPVELEGMIKSHNFDLFTRGALMGTLGATLCLCLGYVEFPFLRDFYHLCMLLDMRLHQKMSFSLHEAMEKGREDYQAAISHLENMGLTDEVKLYKTHEDIAPSEEFKKVFADSGLVHLISKHHERVDASGFPHHLSEGEMSDAECLLIFLDSLFPMHEMSFARNDGKGFFKKAIGENTLNEKVLSIRLEKMFEHIFATLPEEEQVEDISA